MTGHQINSLVGDLVAMAQAMERLPTVEAERDRLTHDLDQSRQTVQDRELAIISYKEQIETLRAKINDVEASRDDAELRFLEADERTTKALDFVKTMFGSAGALVQQLEPPVALPEPQAEMPRAVLEDTWDHFEPKVESASPLLVALSQASSDTPSVDTSVQATESAHGSETEHRAESAVDPTVSEATTQSPTVSSETVQPREGVSAMPEPSVGPYHGKRYHDIPQYVSFDRWIEGGGTYEDYYWRPGRFHSAG